MTLKGQHARSGYYVSENSREGVKMEMLTKLSGIKKTEKSNSFYVFLSFLHNLKKNAFFSFLMPEPQEISTV